METVNVPNLLTTLRIVLIPLFILLFDHQSPFRSVWAALIFLIASLTDLLDGYFARRRDEITRLGKLLDPVADKLLVASALILLVDDKRVPPWIAIIIIGREFAVMGLRAIASSEGIIIAAEKGGKYKMAVLTASIVFLILGDGWITLIDFPFWGHLFLWLGMILAVVSAGQYFVTFTKRLMIGNPK